MATVGKLEKGPEEPGCQQRHDQLWDKECSGVAWAGLAADRRHATASGVKAGRAGTSGPARRRGGREVRTGRPAGSVAVCCPPVSGTESLGRPAWSHSKGAGTELAA